MVTLSLMVLMERLVRLEPSEVFFTFKNRGEVLFVDGYFNDQTKDEKH